MYLKHLSLAEFRNYARLELDLSARVSIFAGENAQGKTNLLEAVYYLATTKSPLASSDRELIRWEARTDVLPYARLGAVFVRAGQERTIDITLVQEPEPGVAIEATPLRKQIRVNGVPRRAIDTVGQLTVVLFLPEDIALVAGSPSERRRYLDITLCQIDSTYCRALSAYNRVLTQRNALLRRIRERLAQAPELEYWDKQLAEAGATVLERRLQAVTALSARVSEIHPRLTDGRETLSISYLDGTMAKGEIRAETPPKERLLQALLARRSEEIARGMTVVGPHRDDLRFAISGIDATVYGSRGQQRTAALAVKMAEVGFIQSETGEMPVLLLDDVVSELDKRRVELLLHALEDAEQVLVTATDLAPYARNLLGAATMWQVENGALQLIS